jgi:hypothetical protein
MCFQCVQLGIGVVLSQGGWSCKQFLFLFSPKVSQMAREYPVYWVKGAKID